MKSTLDIRGSRVEFSLLPGGSPTIILLNGFRMNFSSWNLISGPLTQLGTVLQYNRFGVGKSSSGSFPHTGMKSVEILHGMLVELGLKPPFVFLAHSLGGLIANLYIRLYPEHIAGIVFLEATHPDEKAAQSAYRPPLALRLFSDGIKTIEKFFDKHRYSEDETYADTVAEIERHPLFPAMPIRVITGIKKMPFVPEESHLIHLDCQEKLLKLSPFSQHILAHESGHFPQITEPELVIKVVEELVQSIKNENP